MPNFANKVVIAGRIDAATLLEMTRASVVTTATRASPNRKLNEISFDSRFIAGSSATNSIVQHANTVRTTAIPRTLASGSGSDSGSGPGWFVYDSLNRAYIANSSLTSFTQISSTTIPNLGACNSGTVRYDNTTNAFYTGAITSTKIHKLPASGGSWTQLSVTDQGNHPYVDIAFTPTAIYGLGLRYMVRSTDGGATWQGVMDTLPTLYALKMIVIGQQIVVIGLGVFWASNDGGATWRDIRNGSVVSGAGDITNNCFLYSVMYFNNQFWILGNNGYTKTFILTSPDTVTWTITVLPQWWSPREYVRNPTTGLIVAQVGHPGITGSGMRWSEDNGLTWTDATGSVVGKISSLTFNVYTSCVNTLKYDGTRYITRMSDNTFHTSTDGKNWTLLSTVTPLGGTIVAVTANIHDPNKNLV